MAKKSSLRASIKRYVESNSLLFTDYSNWYIGITNKVGTRKGQHQNNHGRQFKLFKHWEADSARDAADVEREFQDAGMHGAGGGWAQDSYYIYVYKRSGFGA
jgi:hypothetical protein